MRLAERYERAIEHFHICFCTVYVSQGGRNMSMRTLPRFFLFIHPASSSDYAVASNIVDRFVLVSRAKGSHLIPYRTQQLSPSAPMVVIRTVRESRPMPGLND